MVKILSQFYMAYVNILYQWPLRSVWLINISDRHKSNYKPEEVSECQKQILTFRDNKQTSLPIFVCYAIQHIITIQYL